MITEAVRGGATGRADLRRALSDLDGLELASGELRLDNGGGNIGRAVLRALHATVEVTGVVDPVEPGPPIVDVGASSR
jgi:hypothetical protein